MEDAYDNAYATRHALVLKLVQKKQEEEKEKEGLAILAAEEKAKQEQIEAGESKAKEDIEKQWGVAIDQSELLEFN